MKDWTKARWDTIKPDDIIEVGGQMREVIKIRAVDRFPGMVEAWVPPHATVIDEADKIVEVYR